MIFKKLFEKDIDRNFNSVISVEDISSSAILEDAKEFIFTTNSNKQSSKNVGTYNGMLKILEHLSSSSKNNVWLYGFYGSGKSLLAKLTSLLVMKDTNSEIIQVLTSKLQEPKRSEFQEKLALIRSQFETVFILNIGTHKNNSNIAQIITSYILKNLNYHPNIEIAHVELLLNNTNKMHELHELCYQKFGEKWDDWKYVSEVKCKYFISEVAPTLLKEHDLDKKYTSPKQLAKVLSLLPHKSFLVIVDELSKYFDSRNDDIKIFSEFLKELDTVYSSKVSFICTSQKERGAFKSSPLNSAFNLELCLDKTSTKEIIQQRLLLKNKRGKTYLKRIQQDSNLQWLEENFISSYPFLPNTISLLQVITNIIAVTTSDTQTARNALGLLHDVLKRNLDLKEGELLGVYSFYPDLVQYLTEETIQDLEGFEKSVQEKFSKEDAHIAKHILKILAILTITYHNKSERTSILNKLASEESVDSNIVNKEVIHSLLRRSIYSDKNVSLDEVSRLLKEMVRMGILLFLEDTGYILFQTTNRLWKEQKDRISSLINETKISRKIRELLQTALFSHLQNNSSKSIKTKLNNHHNISHRIANHTFRYASTNKIGKIEVDTPTIHWDFIEPNSKPEEGITLELAKYVSLQSSNELNNTDYIDVNQVLEDEVKALLEAEETLQYYNSKVDKTPLEESCLADEAAIKTKKKRQLEIGFAKALEQSQIIYNNQSYKLTIQNLQKIANQKFNQHHYINFPRRSSPYINGLISGNLTEEQKKKLSEPPLSLYLQPKGKREYRLHTDSEMSLIVKRFVDKGDRFDEVVQALIKAPYGFARDQIHLIIIALLRNQEISLQSIQNKKFKIEDISEEIAQKEELKSNAGIKKYRIYPRNQKILSSEEKEDIVEFFEHYNKSVSPEYSELFDAFLELNTEEIYPVLKNHLENVHKINKKDEEVSDLLAKLKKGFTYINRRKMIARLQEIHPELSEITRIYSKCSKVIPYWTTINSIFSAKNIIFEISKSNDNHELHKKSMILISILENNVPWMETLDTSHLQNILAEIISHHKKHHEELTKQVQKQASKSNKLLEKVKQKEVFEQLKLSLPKGLAIKENALVVVKDDSKDPMTLDDYKSLPNHCALIERKLEKIIQSNNKDEPPETIHLEFPVELRTEKDVQEYFENLQNDINNTKGNMIRFEIKDTTSK